MKTESSWLDGQVVTRSSQEQEACDSYFRSVKSDTGLPTARHRRNISSKEAVLYARSMTRRCAPQTRYTLRRNTASIIKDLITSNGVIPVPAYRLLKLKNRLLNLENRFLNLENRLLNFENRFLDLVNRFPNLENRSLILENRWLKIACIDILWFWLEQTFS